MAKPRSAPVNADDDNRVSCKEINQLKKQISQVEQKLETKTKCCGSRETQEATAQSQQLAELTKKVEELTRLVMNGTMQSVPPQSGGYMDQTGPWPPRRFQGQTRQKGNCFHCGQPGHFRGKCPWRVTNPPTMAPSTNQNVSGETPPPQVNNTDKNDVNSASNRQVKHSYTHRVTGMQGGWTLTGIIAGVEVDLLIDSGSDVTLLDPAVYNQIKREHKPELAEVNCSLNTASGDRTESFGAADFELTLGQQSWEYPFVVAQMGSSPEYWETIF